jgi:O-antigen/teichoic acid export membrane protein
MRFSRAFGLTFLMREAVLVFGFVNAISIARGLGAAAYGTYSLAVTTANLLALAGGLGMHYSNNFLAARRPECAGQLFTHSLFPVVLLGGLAALFEIGFPHFAGPLFGNVSPHLRQLTWLGAALVVANLNLAYILYGLQQFKRYSVVTALAAWGTGLTNLVIAGILKMPVIWTIGAWIFWNGVNWGVGCILLWGIARPVFRLDGPLLGESIRLGFRALASSVLSYLSGRGVLYFIDRFLGTAAVGYYSVASSLADLVQHAPSGLGGLVFTKASAEQGSAADLARLVRLHWILSGAVAVGLALGAPWALALLFGTSYGEAITPLRYLVVASYFMGVWVLASSYVAGRRGMPWGLVMLSAFCTGLTLILAWFWIPPWGLRGAALAAAASVAATAAIMLGYLLRDSQGELKPGALLPRPRDLVEAIRDIRRKAGTAAP